MNLGGAIHLNKSGICLILIICLLFFYYFFSHNANTSNVLQERWSGVVDLNDLLKVVIKAAENGGKEVLNAKDSMKVSSKGKTKEGINDPVTTADYNSHCAMIATIQKKFPTLTVVSEEAKTKCDDAYKYDFGQPGSINFADVKVPQNVTANDITIWIDPLDATKEFTEGLYQYVTTMTCVAIKGKPIIGVIHKPFENKTYWAWDGISASHLFLGEIKSNNNHPSVVVSLSHKGTIDETLRSSFNGDINIIAAAGAGYKVLEVVAGRVDAYLHSTAIKKWDICAGNAILNAVNGKMTTKEGKDIMYLNDQHFVNNFGIVATLSNHKKFIGHF